MRAVKELSAALVAGIVFLCFLPGAAVSQVRVDPLLKAADEAKRQGKFDTAVTLYEKYVDEPGTDSVEMVRVLQHVGKLFEERLSQPLRAAMAYRRAFEIALHRGDHARVCGFAYAAALIFIDLAEYAAADTLLQSAEALAADGDDRKTLAAIYRARSRIFYEQGNDSKGGEFRAKAQDLWPSGNTDTDLEGLKFEAFAAIEGGDTDRGIALCDQGIARSRYPSRDHVSFLHNKAAGLGKTGRWEAALASYRQGYEEAASIGLRPYEADCAAGMGEAYSQLRRPDSAAHLLHTAILLHATNEECQRLADDYFDLGLLGVSEGAPAKAVDALLRSVILYERTRRNVAGGREERIGFMQKRGRAYEQCLIMLQQTRQPELAFQVAELVQARTLFEALRSQGSDIPEEAVPMAVADVVNGTSAGELFAEVYDQLGGVAARNVRERLDEESALIEYIVGEERAYAFIFTRDTLALVDLSLPQEIEASVKALQPLLRQTESSAEAVTAAARLSAQVIAPAWQLIRSKRRLYVVPSGPLWLIPFEALVEPGSLQPDSKRGDNPTAVHMGASRETQFLVRKYSITYSQSVGILVEQLRKRSSSRRPDLSLLAVAYPVAPMASPDVAEPDIEEGQRMRDLLALPFARAEVEGIVSEFPPGECRVLMGDEATETSVKQLLNGTSARVVHFATHGSLSPSQSGKIGLKLGRSVEDDGLLEASEIIGLNIPADLVVLSACETGLGEIVQGEGVMGLARSFMLAGAKTVVVSLWRVSDQSTAALMKKFYEAYALNGGDPSEALRTAELFLMDNERESAPYYWAPFVVVGRR